MYQGHRYLTEYLKNVQLECLHFCLLLISKIHTNTRIRDRDLSPSKVDTLLWKESMTLHYMILIDLWYIYIYTGYIL